MKTIRNIFQMMLFGLLAAGCDNFVEADRPNSQLTTGSVFGSAATANAAMADVYAQMRENGMASGKAFGFSCLLGAYADELISYETGTYTTAPFFQNAVLPSDEFIKQLWNGSYNQIYAANAIAEGVVASVALSQPDKDALLGEALFARAFLHFNLMNVFGAVPYVTTTDYTFNSRLPRTPMETIYQHVIGDLETAIALLPLDNAGSSHTRPNRTAAQALLARVYLYQGDNAAAANMASAVLSDAGYAWNESPDGEFLKDSPATIWQLASGAGGNTHEAATFIFYAAPGIVSLPEGLVNQFEPGDLRRQFWVKEVTEGPDSWFHAYKYKQDLQSGTSVEYSIQFRLAELYLIRGEARARQGELTAAKDDIDKIRSRAGLPATTAVTQQEILDAVLQERRCELFTEHGHRFFDLRRFGRLNEVLQEKPGWEPTDALWPLPQAEMLLNPLLVPQNPGY